MRDGHDISVQEANEAVADIDALWFDPDPKSKSGASVRVLGYSQTAQSVLTIILVHREDGLGYYGANGWKSNSTERRVYSEGGEHDE